MLCKCFLIIPCVCVCQVCFLISLTYRSWNITASASSHSSYSEGHCLVALASVISWTILISPSVEGVSSGCKSLICPSFFFPFDRAVDVDKTKILHTRDWMWACFDPRPLKMELLWKFILLLSALVCVAGKPPTSTPIYTFHLVSTEALNCYLGWGDRGEQLNTSVKTTVGMMKQAYSPGPNGATIFRLQHLQFFYRIKFH